ALVQEPGGAELPTRVEPFEARLALMRGDPAAATHWLNTSVLDPTGTAMALLETRLTRVRVALALATEESLPQAEGILPPLLDEVRGRHLTARLIELLALQALLLQARGRSDEARAVMGEALTLAAPGGFIRTFVDLGPAMADLLRALRLR